ncbi:MAG: phosphoglycerate mutase family protein [Roseateles sp.]|uniref:SixA phosphatase family protein n=1 Tax=Roseateles sp. TaxID=1971397 RepID=UPI0039ECCC65
MSPLLPAGLLAAALALPAGAGPDLVVLVRHAERAAEPAGDPALTPAGQQRADALAQALAGLRVNAIVTTPYRRTRDTAAPLARALGLRPQVVEARAGHVQAVADEVRAQTGVVLVVGHGNTVPAVLAALGGPALPDLCDTSFHHVFLLRPGGAEPPRWAQFGYGAPSAAAPQAGCL